MSETQVIWKGMAEHQRFLDTLPEDCATEAGHIIEGEVNYLFQQYKSQLPTGPTGNLKKGVAVIPLELRGRLVPAAGVKNAAFHAHIWEFGNTKTRPRRLKGGEGRRYRAGTNRGNMPAGNLFFPLVNRARKKIRALCDQMLIRKGFTPA